MGQVPATAPHPPAAAEPANGPAAAASPLRRSLKKNMLYAVLGNGFFNGCRFLVVIILAKLATVEILGQYSYANALVSPVILFLTFNMRAAMVADARNETPFGVWQMTRNLGLLASLVVIAVLCGWQWQDGASLALLGIIFFVGLGKVFNQASELCWAMYLKRERLDQVAISNAWAGIVMLAPFLVVTPLYFLLVRQGLIPPAGMEQGAAIAVAIGAAGALAVYLFYDRPKVHGAADADPRWSWPQVWRTLVHVFPLGLVMLIINLCDSVPRLVMEHRTNSTAALGYFGALTYIAMTANLLLIQIGIAAANRLAQYYNSNFRQFLRLTAKLIAVALALGGLIFLGTLLLGRWLLTIFFTPEYAAYFPEFLVVVGSQCLALLISIFGITATQMRLYWLQVSAHAIVLLATLAASWVLITPERPVHGASWTFMIRSLVQLLLYGGCLSWGIYVRARELHAAPPAGRAEPPSASVVSE